MSIVSIDLAKRLQASGMVWEPRAGDWVYQAENIYLLTGVSRLGMGSYADTLGGRGTLRLSVSDGVYWLPTADQCLEALARMGHVVVDVYHGQTVVSCHMLLRELFTTTDMNSPAEAAGLVLAACLEAHQEGQG